MTKLLKPSPLVPPRAARHMTMITRHGKIDEDPYAWLRDANWQEVMRKPSLLGKSIYEHIELENIYTKSILEPVAGLRQELYLELKGRLKEDDQSVPIPSDDFLYYQRYAEGQQHPVYCRRKFGTEKEQILIDGNKEAASSDYHRVAICRHSPNHALIAYSVDKSGSEYYELVIRDLKSGQNMETVTTMAHGDFAWAADSQSIFYTVLNEHHRPNRVLHHRLGETPNKDLEIYQEHDPGFFVDLNKTQSGRFIIITARDHALTAEQRIISATSPTDGPLLIKPREIGIDYSLEDDGERFIILTNLGGAEDYKIVETPIATPGPDNWRDIISHEKGRVIRRLILFKDYLVRLERANALPRITVRSLRHGNEYSIDFEG